MMENKRLERDIEAYKIVEIHRDELKAQLTEAEQELNRLNSKT